MTPAYKNGFKVPRNHEQAMELDRINGNPSHIMQYWMCNAPTRIVNDKPQHVKTHRVGLSCVINSDAAIAISPI